MKNKIHALVPTSVKELQDLLKKTWIEMDPEYFANLAASMPRRIKNALKVKDNMTIY